MVKENLLSLRYQFLRKNRLLHNLCVLAILDADQKHTEVAPSQIEGKEVATFSSIGKTVDIGDEHLDAALVIMF